MPTAAPTLFALNLAAVTASGSALVVVTGTEDGYCWIGDTITVMATPDERWKFAYWTDENS